MASPQKTDPNFGTVRADRWHTVRGDTVQDIADAVSNQNYVKLNSGAATTRKTYSHNGSSTIFFDGDSTADGEDRTVFVDARGAKIDATGSGDVVHVKSTKRLLGNLIWIGGYIDGDGSTGLAGFHLEDAGFNLIQPRQVRGCEYGILAENVENFCEFNWIGTMWGYQQHGCDYGLAYVGNNGAMPGSRTDPAGTNGTNSFRGQYVNYFGQLTDDSSTGLYFDEAQERLYLKDDAGNLNYINLDGTLT